LDEVDNFQPKGPSNPRESSGTRRSTVFVTIADDKDQAELTTAPTKAIFPLYKVSWMMHNVSLILTPMVFGMYFTGFFKGLSV
jgi:hypothetical protein